MRTRKLLVATVWWSLALIFGSTLGWCGAGLPRARESEVPLKAIVRTFNYAEAPGEVLAGGERMAGEIFRHAGIELVWIDCPVSPNDLDNFAACAKLTDLTVKIRNIRSAPAESKFRRRIQRKAESRVSGG